MKFRVSKWLGIQARRLAGLTVWGYLALTVAVTTTLFAFSDVTWWGSVVLFGPRWVWAIGWPLAMAMALVGRSGKQLAAAITSGGLVLFFIIGWVVPWAAWWDKAFILAGRDSPPGVDLQVMTFNLDGRLTNLDQLRDVLLQQAPDLFAWQETPPDIETTVPADWYIVRHGDLLLGSRWPIGESRVILREEVPNRWSRPVGLIARIDHPNGPFTCVSIHPLTPRFGLMKMLDRRSVLALDRTDLWESETQWRWAEHRQLATALADVTGPLVVLGDFNAPVESRIYQSQWGHLTNAFSRAGWGPGATIRLPVRSWNLSARVDHVLISHHWRARQAWVGQPLGSQHLPVFARITRDSPAVPQ